MELHEANRILRSVKSALYADGAKLPPSAETDGLMMLLGKLDCEKFLSPKIKHARTAADGSSAYKRAFTYISFFRALAAVKRGIQDPVSSVSMLMLHKYICGDLDPEAGKPRSKQSIEDGCAHTDPKYIQGSLKAIIAKMNTVGAQPAVGKEDFAGYLTHYMRELIILRPFERGSDFTVRIFCMLFCRIKGFSLCYYRTPPPSVKAAESAAFTRDDVTPLYMMLTDCLSYEQHLPVKRTAPKTRRELSRAEADASDGEKRAAAHDNHDTHDRGDEENSVPIKISIPEGKNGAEDSDKLKRAVKLQQKIIKLNEQLTKLMNSDTND